jgi:hypothetical protein
MEEIALRTRIMGFADSARPEIRLGCIHARFPRGPDENATRIGFHVACRESPNIVVGLVLFALAAFVAYGRWVTAPF